MDAARNPEAATGQSCREFSDQLLAAVSLTRPILEVPVQTVGSTRRMGDLIRNFG